ncbi:MAG: alpha-1,3-galactosidase B, partial [Porphyromonas sp.]|nr:alpha-1,3-galactosidase B [Porphyromonas sp.]
YFTLQADATHFSGCRGHISSVNGLYENMADDAINVHGTYLRVDSILNPFAVEASFAHGQSFGLRWYEDGDSLRFIDRETLLPIHTTKIREFRPLSEGDQKRRMVSFEDPLPLEKVKGKRLAVENLSAHPSVLFSKNIVRNNRARGALFSTPERVVCSENLFDHTHGSAILLCGDANGWYESGPCEEIIISKNRFVNSLTGRYQFTNGVISIDPLIREHASDGRYYHGKVVVEDNIFETFDSPLYYAESVREFIFRRNRVIPNKDYPPLFKDTESKQIHVGNIIRE